MTPLALPFETERETPKAISPDSRLARVAGLFMRKRGLWIDSTELEQIGGRCGWRTRVSECRTVLGMEIRNRQRKAEAGYVISEYGFRVEGR